MTVEREGPEALVYFSNLRRDLCSDWNCTRLSWIQTKPDLPDFCISAFAFLHINRHGIEKMVQPGQIYKAEWLCIVPGTVWLCLDTIRLYIELQSAFTRGFNLRYLKSDEYSTESKHLPTLQLYLPRQKESLGKIISQNNVEAGWFSTFFNTHVYLKAHNTNQKWFSSQTGFPLILCCLKTEHTGGLQIYENSQTGVHWGQLLWPFQQAKKKKKLRLLSS